MYGTYDFVGTGCARRPNSSDDAAAAAVRPPLTAFVAAVTAAAARWVGGGCLECVGIVRGDIIEFGKDGNGDGVVSSTKKYSFTGSKSR